MGVVYSHIDFRRVYLCGSLSSNLSLSCRHFNGSIVLSDLHILTFVLLT
jgi:hypothetical protein